MNKLNVKQFKKRFIRGLVEPDLFKLPLKDDKKETGLLILKTVEKKYVNFDVYNNDFYREKYPNIFNSPYQSISFEEGVLYDSSMTFIAKIGGVSSISVSNIPYGIYYFKIIKAFGYQIPKQPTKIIVDNDTTITTIELLPTYIKHKQQVEDTLVDYKIYSYPEENAYERYGYIWYRDDIILSVNQHPKGTIANLYYDYNNNYLGKVYCGYNNSLFISGGLIGKKGYVLCKTPVLNAQIYGIDGTENDKSNYFCTMTLSFIDKRSYSTIECVPNSIGNLIKINKTFEFCSNQSFVREKYNDISRIPPQPESYDYCPYNNAGFKNKTDMIYGDWNIYDPDTKEKIGEKAYLEDGMTRYVYANCLFDKVRKAYLCVTEYGLTTGTTFYPYENVLENEDTTVYYCNFMVYSDDYDDYVDCPLNRTSYIDYNDLK